MSVDLARRVLLAISVLLLSVTSAAAAGKSHVTAPPNQILNLRAFAPNDNSGGHSFTYDQSGPEFTVPNGFVFVVTDVRILPNLGTFSAASSYLVVINFDDGGSRTLIASFLGAGYDRSFTTGFVIPSGTTPTARNTTFSFEDVAVYLQGYLTKGSALPANTPF
jgi:hypothetical protein